MPKLNLCSSPGKNSLSFNATSHFRVTKKKLKNQTLALTWPCVLSGELCPGAPEPFGCGGGASPGQGLFLPVVTVSDYSSF